LTCSLVVLGLLVATTVGAADAVSTLDEQKTIDALAKQVKSAAVDASLHPDARVAVKFEAPTNAQLVILKKYPNVGAITVLDASGLPEAGFTALKDLPNLRKLILNRAAVTERSAAAIGELKSLRALALISSGVTDAELAGLKKLTRLELLDLSQNPRVTDKG